MMVKKAQKKAPLDSERGWGKVVEPEGFEPSSKHGIR